ncbi:MAG: glycosyl hydrolase family 28 protein [Paludibacter sp.]|jgi:hypothetical protein|nr:glycosyl hydrolase family 28 protein [Paludibacter sp.]
MAIRLNLRFFTLISVFFSIFFTMGCKDAEVTGGIQGVSVSTKTLTMGVGKNRQVYASVYPHLSEGDQIRWSVEDTSIATVEDKGTNNGISVATITAVGLGKVNVIAESVTDSNRKAIITVDVVEFTFEDQAKGMNYKSEKLITYSVPDGYPQEGAPLFNVAVNNKFTGVYTDINAWQKLVSFTYFDFTPGNEVEVEVTTTKSFVSYKILPESKNIISTREGNIIRFKVKEAYQNLSIVFDDNYKGNTLHLFANAIDTDAPTASNDNLIYFGPGYHDLSKTNGGSIVTGNKDVYIAGGAVVSGAMVVSGNGNHVSGHGIMMKTTPNDLVLIANYAKNALIEGIIVCSHRNGGWTVGMHEASNITVQNVKVVSTRYASTDGFDIVNTNNVTMRNTFIRSCDDAIAIKGLINNTPSLCPPNEKMLFEKLQIWNDCNNAMCLGAETRASRYEDIHFKDIDVLFSFDDRDHHAELDERSVMSIVCLEGTYFRNISWEDIRVNKCERLICQTFKNSFWFGSIMGDQTTEGGVEGVTYKNISVASNSGSKIANEILLNGWFKDGTPTKLINNVVFDNVTIQGKRVSKENDIKTNNTPDLQLVTNITFK